MGMREGDRMTGTSEAARIRREYERRAEAIPAGFYGLSKPANYFAHCQDRMPGAHAAGSQWFLPLEGRKIADIGCGTGNWLLEFIQWGAKPENLFGIDLNSPRIGEARHEFPARNYRPAMLRFCRLAIALSIWRASSRLLVRCWTTR